MLNWLLVKQSLEQLKNVTDKQILKISNDSLPW